MNQFLKVCLVALAWLIYGEGRVMASVFGVSLEGVRNGVVLVLIFILFVLSILIIMRCFITVFNRKPTVQLPLHLSIIPSAPGQIVHICIYMTLSCIACELFISLDELAFIHEVYLGSLDSYARDRVWPFDTTSLVFASDIGFWATD